MGKVKKEIFIPVGNANEIRVLWDCESAQEYRQHIESGKEQGESEDKDSFHFFVLPARLFSCVQRSFDHITILVEIYQDIRVFYTSQRVKRLSLVATRLSLGLKELSSINKHICITYEKFVIIPTFSIQ